MTDDLPQFDAARLIADVRKGDEAAIKQAYALTFGHEMGRLVLAHFMTQCGVGRVAGIGDTPRHAAYAAGQHDAGLALGAMAGFDQAAIVVAQMSDNLEGNTDDRSFNHAADGSDYVHGDDFEF